MMELFDVWLWISATANDLAHVLQDHSFILSKIKYFIIKNKDCY